MNDDGLLESVGESPTDDPTRLGGVDPAPPRPKRKHRYDTPKHQQLLKQVQEWYEQEWQRQAHNRYQMALDCDYYDSLQWSEEDAAALLERGQAPVVYNEVKPMVDWMLGTERRTKIDYKVLPRRKDLSEDAEVKTKLLKYLSDTNHEPMARSQAFADAAKAGLGWLEVGVRGDLTEEPVFYRHQSWRQMLYDSNSTEVDLSDARYLFRWKYIDRDIAEAYFPERKEAIRKAAEDGNKLTADEDEDLWYMGTRVTEPGQDYAGASVGKYKPYDAGAFAWSRRTRVRLIECWYRVPVKRSRMVGGAFDGTVYTATLEQQSELNKGVASVHDKVELEMRCCIYAGDSILWEGPSPYEHNRFPFVPIWAYRRARDNAPYGPIRGLRDAQDGMNKRASKALWILSTNQVVMEDGAVDDIEDLRDEIARPDGVIIKRRGSELTTFRDNQLADQHLRLMDRDAMAIRNAGGVTAENLGRQTNADSGKAILARQEQGGVVTTELFDNLRHAVQLAGEIELSLVEQYFTEAKTVRLLGERGRAAFVDINMPTPEGHLLNDITANHADFQISAQDYRDSLRQAMFESLFDIVSRLSQMSPETAFKLLDLVVEMADVPNRDELVSRIRELNGMRDPEADPTPEDQQRAQQEQALQQAQQELVMARAKAELAEIEAKRDKLSAEAIDARLTAMKNALESAQIVLTAPQSGPVADDIMLGAGYVDQSPHAEIGNAQTQRAAAEAAQAMQAAPIQPPPPGASIDDGGIS